MARAFVFATLGVMGCAGSAGPAASNGAAEKRLSSAPAAASSAPAAPVPPLAFADAPVVAEAVAALALRSPANGADLPAATARETRIELAVDARLLPSVELSLDGARARPISILPEQPKLGDLGEIAHGDHYLVATLRTDPKLPARHSVARFGVGTKPSHEPLVFCSRPEGTVYAPAGAKLLLDFVTDGFLPGKDGSVRVQILEAKTGGVRFESLLESAAAREFSLPGADDFAVELQLIDPRGQTLRPGFARDRCNVTRNEVAP